jgi:hypothetical protein
MDALIVFAQHHVHADRDIASMATLRMLNNELTANIDSKYPGYVSDLIALKAARLEARGDALVAQLDALTKEARAVALRADIVQPDAYRAQAIYDALICAFSGSTRLRLDSDLRPRYLAWLYNNFGADCTYLHDCMDMLNYEPVMLITHSEESATPTDIAACKYVPKDMLPEGAVMNGYDADELPGWWFCRQV